ncbi:glycosyltransferase family 2 protein [Chloroflexota bacterium]
MPDIYLESGLESSKNFRQTVMIGIPCFNTKRHITDVVKRASEYADEIIVIDDGSTDNTGELATAAGAKVIFHQGNRGYGKAIKSCFEAARLSQHDVLVILDGDGQHNPDEVPRVIEPILKGEADLVIGSRFLHKPTTMPRYRRFGINIINSLFNFRANIKLSDSQSGFRAYKKSFFQAVILKESGMGVSLEILFHSQRLGLHIKEVPITCVYHDYSSVKNPILHGIGVTIIAIKYQIIGKFLSYKNIGREKSVDEENDGT